MVAYKYLQDYYETRKSFVSDDYKDKWENLILKNDLPENDHPENDHPDKLELIKLSLDSVLDTVQSLEKGETFEKIFNTLVERSVSIQDELGFYLDADPVTVSRTFCNWVSSNVKNFHPEGKSLNDYLFNKFRDLTLSTHSMGLVKSNNKL